MSNINWGIVLGTESDMANRWMRNKVEGGGGGGGIFEDLVWKRGGLVYYQVI